MSLKKVIYFAVLMLTLSTLLMNKASGSQIFIFAPWNYAGINPSNPQGFTQYGGAGPSYSTVDTATGLTSVSGYASGGWAESEAGTGAWQYTGINQAGSIHGDCWFNGRVGTGGGKIIVTLLVLMYDPNTNTIDYFTKSVTYAAPGLVSPVVDIGISTFTGDVSSPNNLNFQWNTGFWYNAIMKIRADGGVGSTWKFMSTLDGKYDDILFITYTSSPEPHWIRVSSDAEAEFNQAVEKMDLATKNFEEASVSAGPSETAVAMPISIEMPIVAAVAIFALSLLTLRRKVKTNKA